MKKALLVFFTLATTVVCAQEPCENFKTGKFLNIEKEIIKAEIWRNDSIQTEKYGAKEIKLRIDWIDNCSYRLKFLEGNTAFWNSRPKNMSTPDLIVRIISTDSKSYTQEAKFEGEAAFNYKSKIVKID